MVVFLLRWIVFAEPWVLFVLAAEMKSDTRRRRTRPSVLEPRRRTTPVFVRWST